MKAYKRPLRLAIISDVHLGTYGCRAGELLQYLKSIDPETLILNGDIVDIWQFKKSYFPAAHLNVIKYVLGLVVRGKNVIYVTGNHDEFLRRFVGFKLANFEIVNKVVLDLDGRRAWCFHGDVFDVTMRGSKWLAKLGGIGYDFLIRLNNVVNWVSESLGRGRISLSKRIKSNVKRAIKYIDDFEQTAARIAIDQGYDFVLCGHIHQPQHRNIDDGRGGSVTYLNSGDWVENLTALEYTDGRWSIYEYHDTEQDISDPTEEQLDITEEQIVSQLMAEFHLSPA